MCPVEVEVPTGTGGVRKVEVLSYDLDESSAQSCVLSCSARMGVTCSTCGELGTYRKRRVPVFG